MFEKFTPFGEKPQEIILGSIEALIEKEKFHLTPEERGIILEQVDSGKRFAHVVAEREENGEKIERFLKIPLEEDSAIDIPFQRQILFGKFLKADGRVKTRDIVSDNLNRTSGTPFAIMETFKEGEAKIGFISGPEDMELLTTKEAGSCIKTLETLQGIDVSKFPPELKEVLQDVSDDADVFLKEIMETLEQKVTTFDSRAKKPEAYHEVLNRRLGVSNFKELVVELLEKLSDVIKREDGEDGILFHGDLAPNNLYVYDNGEVEFLDLEWAGVVRNRALATIYDFGNLRARAWNNKEFRESLDKNILEAYKNRGEEELGKAIVSLGILRSHMMLAGFFENYPLEKQRREEELRRKELTEADIPKAWEILGLKLK